MARRKSGAKEVDQIEGKFIFGWAEFLSPINKPIVDDKGRLLRTEHKPPKIVTRLMVELEDGECVSVDGEHFESMETSVKGAFQAAFASKFKEVAGIAGKAYKKGAKVKVKRTVYKDNGWVDYYEIE